MEKQKIEDILKSISNDILTEEVKSSIAKMFTEAVEEKVQAQSKLIVENELSKMDTEHTTKLEKLVEAIDTDHTSKFKAVIQQIDEAHTAKLKKVIAKHETDLKEGAEKLRGELIAKVSNYLDLYLAESIPADQLKEAVENIRARKMLNEIKKIVAIDPEFISENFKEALKDGHTTIEKLRGELNDRIKESVGINQKLMETQAALIMEQKTRGLPENKKQFVTRLLEGKKPEEIEANFKFVLEMFDRDETDKIETAKVTATAKAKVVAQKVDVPKQVIQESVSDSSEGLAVAGYMEELEKSY
jgi:Fe-S cluster biosynthesis and repair protein YggX